MIFFQSLDHIKSILIENVTGFASVMSFNKAEMPKNQVSIFMHGCVNLRGPGTEVFVLWSPAINVLFLLFQNRCKHYMIPRDCAYFSCCACLGIKNFNASTRFEHGTVDTYSLCMIQLSHSDGQAI